MRAVTRSWIGKTAEGEGFEPPGTCIPKLFKSFAFGRSAIPPESGRSLAYGRHQESLRERVPRGVTRKNTTAVLEIVCGEGKRITDLVPQYVGSIPICLD
jgi:hypothetical protein